MKKTCIPRLAGCAVALWLTACGGSDEPAGPPPPVVPPHATATVAMTADSAPFLVANAQAATLMVREWLVGFAQWNGLVSPRTPQNISLCGPIGGPGNVTTNYVDLDHDGGYSAGDRIVTVAQGGCDLDAMSDGTTTLTVLATRSGAISDYTGDAGNTFDDTSMGYYDWSERIQGQFRMTAMAAGQVQVLGVGDIHLALSGGPVLLLRNLAIVVDQQGGVYRDMARLQFDLVFQSGRDAGQQVQVDGEGTLLAEGANTAPAPGTLLVSGSGATRARLAGDYIVGTGPRFITTIDAGDGTFAAGSNVDDFTFYAAGRQ